MKKSVIVLALAAVMVFAFAGSAFADHSPQFYFDFEAGAGVTEGAAFEAVFPSDFNAYPISWSIDNGSWALGTATPHKGYSQTTAKCGVCHSVHRAPTRGTASTAAPTTSSRYALTAYTSLATPDTQLLLKSTANGACDFCHVVGGHSDMYGGDVTKMWVSNPDAELSWNEFYGHTTGCVSCHAVHGANAFPGSKILKYKNVKSSSTFALKVQPELYSSNYIYDAAGVKSVKPIMWANEADMMTNTIIPATAAAGVTQAEAAVTGNCSICHANYSGANNALINYTLDNVQLFQSGAWANANGETTAWDPGVKAGTWSNTFSMMYKNHPMKAAAANFASPGDTVATGSVSVASSFVCQDCHSAPGGVKDGAVYIVQSFPHYTPGYYKFMVAQDQTKFATPDPAYDAPNPGDALWAINLGRLPYFTWADDGLGKDPATMNDGYCVKCHINVGVTF